MAEKRKSLIAEYQEAVLARKKKAREEAAEALLPKAVPIPTKKVERPSFAERMEMYEEHFEERAPPNRAMVLLRAEMDKRFLDMDAFLPLLHEKGTNEGLLHDLRVRTWSLAMKMCAGDALDRLRNTMPFAPNECFVDEVGAIVHPLSVVLEKLRPCGMRMNDTNYWDVMCCKMYVRHLRAMGLNEDLPMYPNGWRNVTVKQHVADRIAPLWESIRRSEHATGGLHHYLAMWLAKEFGIELK